MHTHDHMYSHTYTTDVLTHTTYLLPSTQLTYYLGTQLTYYLSTQLTSHESLECRLSGHDRASMHRWLRRNLAAPSPLSLPPTPLPTTMLRPTPLPPTMLPPTMLPPTPLPTPLPTPSGTLPTITWLLASRGSNGRRLRNEMQLVSALRAHLSTR